MATTISTQDLIDVKRDIEDIGKAVNEKVIVSPRYGDDFKSLPMIAEEFQISSDAAEAAAVTAVSAAQSASSSANIAEAAATAATIGAGVFETPEAGVNPVTGVTDGAYFNVRSSSNESYVDEYQNVGGVPTPSGKSYPSAGYVQAVAEFTALPFVPGESYGVNRRVQLDNGDIVKSTVAGNTANPNFDMTGWFQTSIFTHLNIVDNWGAKGDGVTQDTSSIQAAIDYLNAKFISSGEQQTLLFMEHKTYVCHGLVWKAGVHLSSYGAGKARLLKTPATAGQAESELNWRRVLSCDTNIGIDAPNIRHRIESLVVDGNYENMNWTYNSYNQEQGMNIILSASNGESEDARAKFELINVDSINSVSDGLCVNTNIDLIFTNYKSTNCFRGGLVIVGGNTIVNGVNLTLNNAGIDIEVDGPAFSNSLKADVNIVNCEINKANPKCDWGGISCHVKNGAVQSFTNLNTYSHGLTVAAGDNNQGNQILFKNCRLQWVGETYNIPKLMRFDNCTFVSDFRGANEKSDGFGAAWYNQYTAETAGAEIIFNGGHAYALYDDISKVGAFIKLNTGGMTTDAVNNPYKMVRFLNGFKIKDFEMPFTSTFGGASIEFDNVYINTRRFLNPVPNNNVGIAGSIYIELGSIKLGVDNTQFYAASGTAEQSKVVIRGMTLTLAEFLKNIDNGGNYPSYWDVNGQMTLAVQSFEGVDLNNTIAFIGTRLVSTTAKIGYPCEYTAYPQTLNGTKASLNVKWVATKWATGSFATADLPVLTAFDVGVTNYDTTTNTFKRWTGTAWI